jgi:predicted dehydrogenase
MSLSCTFRALTRLTVATSLTIALLSTLPVHARAQPATGATPPLRLVIAGLVHGHVDGFLRQASRTPVDIVGVYEPDAALRARKLTAAGLPESIGAADLDALLARTRPEAVAVFSSTADHPRLVEIAARHQVHVMMEKPLAVNVADARAIEKAAAGAGIHVIVNYETTWYPSLGTAWRLMKLDKTGGAIRKLVAMDGHSGPKEIGVGPEFLSWLTDPVQNGAGALFDFGCYGANLMTWLMDGARPLSVRALTQQLKPHIYSKVDDEATILLEYPGTQGIVQASWNWPVNRKDLEVYAERAYAIATGREDVRMRVAGKAEERVSAEPLTAAEADSIAYLTAVARGAIVPGGRSSLANNVIVTEILEAARESARTGRVVPLAGTAPGK